MKINELLKQLCVANMKMTFFPSKNGSRIINEIYISKFSYSYVINNSGSLGPFF